MMGAELVILWFYWTSDGVTLAPTQILGAFARATVLAREA